MVGPFRFWGPRRVSSAPMPKRATAFKEEMTPQIKFPTSKTLLKDTLTRRWICDRYGKAAF